MRKALTSHLPPASPEEAVEIANAVEIVRQEPGYAYIIEGVQARLEALRNDLLNKGVRESAAEYERIIGEMRGLESLEAIVEGLEIRPSRMSPQEVVNG